MRNILRLLLITALSGLLLCSYSDAAAKKTQKPMPTSKGAQYKMKTYYLGRFAIDLPEEFKLEIQSQKVRYAEVSDFKWKDKDRDKERNALWAQKIEGIKKLTPPKSRKQIIIEEKELKGIGHEAKAIVYYGNQYAPNCTYWTILADYGTVGMWLTLDGEDDSLSIKNFTNILKHYQYGFSDLTKDSFCLNYGRIELPYLEHERTYARFSGPMGMKLAIHMNETHEVEEAGLLESFAAALATNFAPGVAVDRIRVQKRTIGGLKGDELVTRMTEVRDTDLYFAWKYLGKEDSGEHPEIRIVIQECPDGNLDEKMKIWDQILDSFRPAYTR